MESLREMVGNNLLENPIPLETIKNSSFEELRKNFLAITSINYRTNPFGDITSVEVIYRPIADIKRQKKERRKEENPF